MISFSPTEDQKLMVESVAQLARTTLRPKVREFERERALPEAIRKTAHELGLSLVAIPERLGGAGLGMTTAILLEEEIAWGDPAAGFAFGGPGALGFALLELATEEQAKTALAPFAGDGGHARFGAVAWGEAKAVADRPGFATMATKTEGGWRLDGTKSYVVNADRADTFVVFAQVDASKGWRGLGAFLVEKSAKGLDVLPRARTLGLDAASFGGIRLEGAIAKERLDGCTSPEHFDAALVRFFARQALVVAARGVGLSRAAFDVTRDYVDQRKAFGKPIGHFQAVAFTIADRAIDVDAARGLVWRAAAAWDAYDAAKNEKNEKEALLRTAQAVAYTHEAAMRCGDDGVQLHGGAGFVRDYVVEKLMRDAKQLGLCAMTAEHADQLASAVELGIPLDAGLVLPSPETQNAFV
jgi:alkylation response protein AidB-like acyl-CoA dehydrogenase